MREFPPRLEVSSRKSDGLFPVRSVEEGKKLFNVETSRGVMPRTVDAVEATSSDPVRVCSECRRAKTIRGVWYLVPRGGASPFVCETCFASRPAMRALS